MQAVQQWATQTLLRCMHAPSLAARQNPHVQCMQGCARMQQMQWLSSKHYRPQCTICKSCEPILCTHCGPLSRSAFSQKTASYNFISHHQNVLCSKCSKKGLAPGEGAHASNERECMACNQMCKLVNFRAVGGVRKDTCKACERIPCAPCGKEQPNSSHDINTADNFWKRSRKVVCSDCKNRGCTNSDPRLYQCNGPCKLMRGTCFFDKVALKNWKSCTIMVLQCSDCKKGEAVRKPAMKAALDNRGLQLHLWLICTDRAGLRVLAVVKLINRGQIVASGL